MTVPPRQNRVTPFGDIVAVPERGLFFGNRGCLHDGTGTIVRWQAARAWITCVLEWKGRRRPLLQPGRYTELFFLDEATALAAGHRPCAECRRVAFNAYQGAWAAAEGRADRPRAPEMDARLDRARRAGPDRLFTHAVVPDLPDGAMVDLGGHAHLVLGGRVRPWSPGGYGPVRAAPARPVPVLTPAPSVACLVQGYQPRLHPSALAVTPPGRRR